MVQLKQLSIFRAHRAPGARQFHAESISAFELNPEIDGEKNLTVGLKLAAYITCS